MFTLLLALMPSQVFAHTLWKPGSITPPRDPSDGQLKYGPCGGINNQNLLPRGIKPKIFKPGEQISIEWIETINHGGQFVIDYLDSAYLPVINTNEVTFPDSFDDVIVRSKPLLRSELITIPNTECPNCSIRIVQQMWFQKFITPPPEKNPDGTLNYTKYFSCSDIRIESTNNTAPGEIIFTTTQSRINNANNVILNWINPGQLNPDPTSMGFKNVAYRVLILQSNSTINIAPLDGTQYSVNEQIGGNNGPTVVYDGNLETTTIALLANTNSSDQYFKIFTYNVSNLYSNGVESAPTPVVPVQPILNLSMSQGNLNSPVEFDRTNGMITATANVTNATLNESYSYNWSSTNAMLVDQTMNKTDEIFQFDPSALNAGDYNVSLTATSDISGLTSTNKIMAVKIVVPQPVGSTPPPTTPVSNNETASGGCTISSNAKFDPLLLILALFSLGLINFRLRMQK